MSKKKQAPVMIEAVVDRSGSMQSIVDDAIGGFNTWLAEQQALPGEASLTLSLFDHENIVTSYAKLADAKPLDNKSYVPRGSTALNDTIGQALNRMEAANPDKAILMILTDGMENCSREFTHEQVRQKIQAAEKRGWQVVYVSAHADAFAHGAQYGVSAANTLAFANIGAGVRVAYTSASTMNANYRANASVVTTDDDKE